MALNLEKSCLSLGDQEFKVNMPQEQRLAFLAGTWNATALLAERLQDIKALGDGLPYKFNFLQK